jgi:hypothetical protein
MTLLEADGIQRLEQFGEDTHDLLRVIQASFGIEFTTDDLVRTKTIGELGGCICGKLKHPVSEQCLSAVVFYRLRRAFIDLFDTPRALIKPDKPLLELMPWTDRRKRWRGVQKQLGLVLPDLRWPRWLLCSSLVIAGSVSALIVHGLAQTMSNYGIGLGLPVVVIGVLTWALMLKLLSPLARAFPRSCEAFGDLVQLALARGYAAIASQRGGASEREVLLALRRLIAAEIGTDVNKVRPETYFPEGLNIY